MKHLPILLLLLDILLTGFLCSCSGEDRTGEMPVKPTKVTIRLSEYGTDAFIAEGYVESSPNSPLIQCGFRWGNDTLSVTEETVVAQGFADTICPPGPGTYYIVAYAANYIGESCSDTLFYHLGNE